MKLHEVATPSKDAIPTRAEKQELNKARSEKSADLGSYVSKVWDAKDLESKKAAARQMASHFTAGGKDKFLSALENLTTPAEVDKHASNAMLKGEGNGKLRY